MSRSRLRAPAVLVAACLSCGQGGGDSPSIDAPRVIPPPVLPTFQTISIGDPVLGEIAAQQVSRYGAAVTAGVEYVVALLGRTGSVALHVYGDDASLELPRECFSARAAPRTQDCSLGFAPAVVSDGSAGAIVLWADDILPAGWMQDVYAQHIGASP